MSYRGTNILIVTGETEDTYIRKEELDQIKDVIKGVDICIQQLEPIETNDLCKHFIETAFEPSMKAWKASKEVTIKGIIISHRTIDVEFFEKNGLTTEQIQATKDASGCYLMAPKGYNNYPSLRKLIIAIRQRQRTQNKH